MSSSHSRSYSPESDIALDIKLDWRDLSIWYYLEVSSKLSDTSLAFPTNILFNL